MPAKLFDLSDWSQIEITGRDRQSFLHGFCTNDVKRLAPGEGCEAFLSNIKGRIIGHLQIFADDRRLCLESEPGQAAAVIAHLDKYLIAEDVQLFDRSRDWRLLLLAGDEGEAVIQQAGLLNAVPRRVGDHDEVPVPGSTGAAVSIRRVDTSDLPCWTFSAAASAIDDLRTRLVAAGAEQSERSTFESLRIEHGYPLFGVDLTEDNLVHESDRVKQTVSFTKGCYLGQEPIARLDALGHVNRHLCRLRFSSTMEVGGGAKVLHAATSGAEVVGHVTSAAPLSSSRDKTQWGAIALVKREAAVPGTNLLIDVGSPITVDATVAPPN